MSDPATLPSLLWTVLGGLEHAYTRQAAGFPGMPSLDLWANLLRVMDEVGTDEKVLPSILCLSRRAVKTRLALAVRGGWAAEFRDQGRTRVRLTARGSEAARRCPLLQEHAEKQRQTELGVNETARLRASLMRIVAAFPLEHPHYPASYGAADASFTGGNGKDWIPVKRMVGSAVTSLPLSALVSQAIVAFAIDYEKISPVAFSLSTEIIRQIPAEGRSLRELANSVGISALVRHGFLSVHGPRRKGIAFLTSKGIAVRDGYDQRVETVERAWCDRFGNESVAALRRSLEEVTSAACGRTRHVSGLNA